MDDLKGKFPMVLSQELIWSDMDSFQHINNAVYLRYFEDVRIAYFEKLKVIEHKHATQIGPILASTSCNFRAPLTYPDTIQIATSVEEVGRKRFKMKYLVYSERLKRLAAEGEGLIVYYDYEQERSCEIPEIILAAINVLQRDFD